MIQATFIRHKGNLESVELIGHAGSGEYGFDIVCAAVSTLSINLVNSLEALADCNADLAINEIDGGYMKIDISHVTEKTDEKVQLYLKLSFRNDKFGRKLSRVCVSSKSLQTNLKRGHNIC